jgi:phosphatidylserine/phosphatidylglycerophosphate/cardiolipin synthase-like enzyme
MNDTALHIEETRASFYVKGVNCTALETASHAAVIVDCAHYYHALHEAISRAQKSIFIVGWDIDSRIELLRGEDAAKADLPTRFFDLICWKARQNPHLAIYLNRWDYSFYMAAEREGLSRLRWQFLAPRNVYYALDGNHPLGACHHQKIVVIDDELAFVGGMDVALARWDYRQHRPRNRGRVDPGGAYQLHTKHSFAPHHDVMMMVAGNVVHSLAKIVRERWLRLRRGKPVPIHESRTRKALPHTWPHEMTPDFHNVEIAVARTMPPEFTSNAVHEIEQLYLDQIAHAECFIYMENQYFTRKTIAESLNKQLRDKPNLCVLLVTCHNPQGIFERKGMWSGRVFFRDILMRGDVGGRVEMVYPVSREKGDEAVIRIHSKVMVVDDSFLHIGSANANNRSMRLDSECDLSIAACDDIQSARIAAIRNDLIREHTGLPLDSIEHFIHTGAPIAKFLNYRTDSRQHLHKCDDEKYRYQNFMSIAMRLADAERPLFVKG